MTDYVMVHRARLRAIVAAVLAFQARTGSADPALLASVAALLTETTTRSEVSMSEYAAITGLSLSTVRRRVADGSLPSRKLGRRVLVAMNVQQASGALTALDATGGAG
jgi:excisionase family DNA binding protein